MLPTRTLDQAHHCPKAAWDTPLPPSSLPSTRIRTTATETSSHPQTLIQHTNSPQLAHLNVLKGCGGFLTFAPNREHSIIRLVEMETCLCKTVTPNSSITSTAIKQRFNFVIKMTKYKTVSNYLSKPNMTVGNGWVWNTHCFHLHYQYLLTASASYPVKVWPKVKAAM